MDMQTIVAIIREELDRRGTTPFRAAVDAGLPDNAIRYVLEGRQPKSERLAAICAALDLDFYIGPPRDSEPASESAFEHVPNTEIASILGLAADASSNEILAAITALAERANRAGRVEDRWDQDQVQAELAALREAIGDLAAKESPATYRVGADLDDPAALAVGATNDDPGPATRLVGVVELRAAAGSGAEVLDETVVGQLGFRRQWLDRHAIDPTQAVVISVQGESMEPTLPDGCSILVDRARRRRLAGHIYVLRTGDGIIVKRLEHTATGWQIVSDHQTWKPITWTDNAEVIGKVRWMARSL